MSKRKTKGVTVRGAKPLMKNCVLCGKEYQRILMGQRLCKDCLKVKKKLS